MLSDLDVQGKQAQYGAMWRKTAFAAFFVLSTHLLCRFCIPFTAFSYAPLPFTADQKIESGGSNSHIYLLDNASPNAYIPSHGFWSLVKNQIFLGLLGSSVRPRKEIEPLINSCAHAGVRFVYFSPRNMRRTKELASQMGIDVGWNCAISLRPLKEGFVDSFRMQSNYADWDVNARLPHGVEDVRRHLKEVDNVPLLVSLYTDVTKKTAADMVSLFFFYTSTLFAWKSVRLI